jgi:hypothetical protein
MCLLPLADGPPLKRGFADPAEPDRLCRKLHARAFLVSIASQVFEIWLLSVFLGFGLKLGQEVV